MTTTTERKKFPIIAGMPLNNPRDMRLKKVGYYVIEFTYQVYPDGDKVLIGEKKIKNVIY